MSEASPDFGFDSLEPHIPITASQVDRSKKNVQTKSKVKEVALELTSRQKLGNKVFFYSFMSGACWAALFMTWAQTTLRTNGFLKIQLHDDLSLAMKIAGLAVPIWTIAGLASLGAAMCVANLLKLTGIKRRYVFVTLGLAVFLSVRGFSTLSLGRHPGLGLFITVASTVSLFIYSWIHRTALR